MHNRIRETADFDRRIRELDSTVKLLAAELAREKERSLGIEMRVSYLEAQNDLLTRGWHWDEEEQDWIKR